MISQLDEASSRATHGEASEPWTSAQRHAFRCAFVLTVLASTRIALILAELLPAGDVRQTAQSALFPLSASVLQALLAIGAAILTVGRPPDPSSLDGADAASSALFYATGLTAVMLSAAGLWALVDRRRTSYARLNAWMRLYVRVVVAVVTGYYATMKVVPVQFGFITPGEALRAFGELSRFHVLWNFMAASPQYARLTGLVELCGAGLLLGRRTVAVGALLLFGAFSNILALDVAYDVRGGVLVAVLRVGLTVVITGPYVRSWGRSRYCTA